jgi:putative transposase
VVQIDDGKIRAHLDEMVRSTVEETLNALLDAEADFLCGALTCTPFLNHS